MSRVNGPLSGGFARQVMGLLAASLVVLALISSTLTSVLLNQQAQRWVRASLVQLTGQFAEQGVSALLVADPRWAHRTLAAWQAFPGVRAVALLSPELQPVWTSGAPVTWSLASHPGAWQTAPAWAGEDGEHWYFAAPVQMRPQRSPLTLQEEPLDRLGYVQLVWAHRPLRTLSAVIFAINGGVSLAVAVLAIILLRRRLRRLSAPLQGLAEVMRRAQQTAQPVRAPVQGPAETRAIATVFNALMDQLDRQRASLEAEVTIRTLELREARDAALSAARYKTEFTALITHDMRTLLHSLRGYQQLALEEAPLVVDARDAALLLECLHHAWGVAEDLAARLQEILELARLEAGKAEVHPRRTDLARLVEAVLTLVRPNAAQRRNRLSVSLTGARLVWIDRDKVLHILLNLLTNACQFTERGQITLTVACTDTALVITVADTGCGIPLAQQARIFEPFQQVPGHRAGTTGTGLGLAITRRFCELLGGTVTVDSEPGRGATFRVVIPRAPATSAGTARH